MRIFLVAVLLVASVACSEGSAPTPAPPPAPSATSTPRPSLADLPVGPPPRIGYAERRTWVAPDGRRTPLPARHGISAIVPYAEGFLIADTRHFEGTVGLWFITEDEVRDLPGCSTGTPRRARGRVWWVTAHCPESLDIVRAEIHSSRPDGRDHRVRVLRAGPRENLIFTAGRTLDRVAPAAAWVREDDEHRLRVVHRRDQVAIVRVDGEGRRELAAPPIVVRGAGPGYVLGPGR